MNAKSIKCLTCNNEHTNPKFCSRSCAAIWTNKKYPKKKKTRFPKNCKMCGKQIDPRSEKCKKCNNSFGDITLEQAIYKKHHRSSAYALIRTRARISAKKYNMDKCEKCGYKKHVEIAHKKAINSFDKNTLISVINHKNNLIALCPNCHWEYDNKL